MNRDISSISPLRTYRSNQIMKGREEKDWQFASPMETPLGFGWYSPWFARVTSDGSYLDGQGNFMYFERGEGITWLFNSEGNLKQIKDDAGNSVTLVYTDGKPTGVKDVLGRTVLTFGYNSLGRLGSVTDLAGRTVSYDYDGAQNLTKATLTLPGGQPAVVLGRYDYDLTNYSTLPMTCSYNTVATLDSRKTFVSCRTRDLPPADQFGYYCVSREWWHDGSRYSESYCVAPQYNNNYHGLIKKTDVAGNSYTIDYYPNWRNKGIVRGVTDPQGRTTTFINSFPDRTFTYTDYSGRTFRKILNDKGQLLQLVELLPGNLERQLTKVEYLENRTTRTTDVLGNVTSEQKDEWGNTIKRIDADGNEWRYQHDANGRQIAAINPLGTTTRYEYDAAGNRTKEIQAAGTPDESVTTYTYSKYRELLTATANGSTTGYAYDDGGNLTGITDPEQNTTSMAYDAAGNLLSRTIPLIGSTTYAGHDWKGNPRTITDPGGTVTVNTYDVAGRILTTTIDATTTYGYTPAGATCSSGCTATGSDNGKISYVILPEGNRVDYGYDTNGNLTTITDNDGNKIVYNYDNRGNKIKEEIKDQNGALQKTVSHQYDLLNRLNKTINPDQGETINGYDKRGNRIILTNPNGNSTTYVYDKTNRLIKVTQPGDVQTTYTYDRRNNLTSVTDANGNTTTYDYDKQNRLTRTTSPDTGVTTYSYDKNGNLKTKTDAKNVTATYSYDQANRLVSISFPDPIDNVTYAYDDCVNGKGRLCTVVDPSGTTTYEYTVRGQIAKETRTIDGRTFVTEYGYDRNGNNTTLKYPSGRTISYGYANDKVTTIQNNGTTLASSIAYKPFGGLAALTFGNGIIQTNTYDQQYRLTGIAANSTQNLSYGYDRNGNITNISDNLDLAKTKSYGYDPLGRLTQATGPWGSLSYGYDKVGNRKTESHNDQATSYGYKPNTNQLTSVSGEKNYSFGFDQNGNTSQENTRNYIYNQNQRLIRVTEQTTTQNEQGQDVTTTATKGEYVYSGNGQRAKKATNGQKTYFVYDQQGKLIEESGATSADYVFLNGSPYAKLEGATTYYIHIDHLGTPLKMTDGQKQPVWEISAKPFGETIGISGTASNNFRFPGQYWDEETGLHQNWHREYSVTIEKYIQADPVVTNFIYDKKYYFIVPILLPDPSILSTYNYARLNSITHIDPEGLYSPQKPGCDGIPNILETKYIRRCCDHHDKCFDQYKCSVKSWAPRNCEPKECKYCNLGAAVCIFSCFANNNGPIFGGPPVTSPWYGI